MSKILIQGPLARLFVKSVYDIGNDKIFLGESMVRIFQKADLVYGYTDIKSSIFKTLYFISYNVADQELLGDYHHGEKSYSIFCKNIYQKLVLYLG